ncbi:hypothetical protein [Kineococcus sp. G2]|uniref:hypothetical protein n=1 Tax=Kineococcus sp. G2 TaxID=3127484 RepID=UPI00301C27FD
MTLTAVGALSACSPSEASVGMGIPHLSDLEGFEVVPVAVDGVVRVTEQGCFTLDVLSPADQAADGLWVVWPDDAVQDDKTVHLSDDVSLTEGSRVSGDGMIVALNALPGGADENSMIGMYGRFCGVDTSNVVVLRHVAEA